MKKLLIILILILTGCTDQHYYDAVLVEQHGKTCPWDKQSYVLRTLVGDYTGIVCLRDQQVGDTTGVVFYNNATTGTWWGGPSPDDKYTTVNKDRRTDEE